jgi:hypothetical protein
MGVHVDDFGCVPDGQVLDRVGIAAGSAALGSPDGDLGSPCQPNVIYGDALSTAEVEQPVASATVTATTTSELGKHWVNQRCDDGECPAVTRSGTWSTHRTGRWAGAGALPSAGPEPAATTMRQPQPRTQTGHSAETG